MVKPSDLNIFHLSIWARFYDIRFKGRGKDDNAKMLGNKVGVFLEVYKSSRESFDKSMRIKVLIDVHNPLKDYVTLKIRGGHVCSIRVKYERLPMFCFLCGRLGHGSNDCMDVSGDRTPEKKYGASLRASPLKFVTDEKEAAGGAGHEYEGKTLEKRLFVTKPVEYFQHITIKGVLIWLWLQMIMLVRGRGMDMIVNVAVFLILLRKGRLMGFWRIKMGLV